MMRSSCASCASSITFSTHVSALVACRTQKSISECKVYSHTLALLMRNASALVIDQIACRDPLPGMTSSDNVVSIAFVFG